MACLIEGGWGLGVLGELEGYVDDEEAVYECCHSLTARASGHERWSCSLKAAGLLRI
jgi:hypothetical protein